MITEVKEDIRNKLVADTELLELLGDPTDAYQRVYWFQPPDPPVFPMVVVRADFGGTEPIDRAILSSIGSLTVTIWAKTNVYETIAERIIYLLHHANISTTLAIRIVLDTEPGELYDEELDAYGKVLTFNLFVRRAII